MELTRELIIREARRCAGLDMMAALEAGGRWMAEHWVMHWTIGDVECYLYGKPKKKNK